MTIQESNHEPIVTVCPRCGEDELDCNLDCDCGRCQEAHEADLRTHLDSMNKLYYLASGGDHARMQREAEELARDCRADQRRMP